MVSLVKDKLFPVYILTFLISLYVIYLTFQRTTSVKRLLPQSFLPEDYDPTPVAPEDKKTITWIIHMYPPAHNAGAEWMAHAMNKYLIEKHGYKVNVIVPHFPIREFEGVNIIKFDEESKVNHAIRHCSAIFSHLNYSNHAVLTAAQAKRPCVLVMHNDLQELFLRKFQTQIQGDNLHLVHNSEWIKDLYKHFGMNSCVVYPPVNWKEYRVPASENQRFVTLINLNRNKGGQVFTQIARKMPDVEFLGVEGGYDIQIKDTSIQNIQYIPNTPVIQNVYKKTKILLVPSQEESWGRVAIEAMSSGIPVIANPTPGLREACGYGGIFVERTNVDEWVRVIRKLLTEQSYYKQMSKAAFSRAQELYPDPQLNKFASWLSDIEWTERDSQ